MGIFADFASELKVPLSREEFLLKMADWDYISVAYRSVKSVVVPLGNGREHLWCL
jgi:hypothetical protein